MTKILNILNYFSTNTLLKKLSRTYFIYPLKYFQPCKNAVVLEPVSCWASNLRKESVMDAKSLSAAGGFKSQDKESAPFVHWEVLWHLPHIITFSSFYSTQCRMYEQKPKKKPGQDNCGKDRSKSQIAQTYRIPIYTLLTYLKNQDPTEQQALKEGDILQHMRICEAKHGTMENELFCMVLPCSKLQYCSGWPNGENEGSWNGTDFKGFSSGRRQWFKERQNITCKSVSRDA